MQLQLQCLLTVNVWLDIDPTSRPAAHQLPPACKPTPQAQGVPAAGVLQSSDPGTWSVAIQACQVPGLGWAGLGWARLQANASSRVWSPKTCDVCPVLWEFAAVCKLLQLAPGEIDGCRTV